MHDIRTEFFVRVSRTSFLDRELGLSVMGLSHAMRGKIGDMILSIEARQMLPSDGFDDRVTKCVFDGPEPRLGSLSPQTL